MNLYDETRFIMKQNNITANKKLGQNFLVDENVVDSIVDSADVTKEDLVICIELDHKMINILENRFKLYDNIEIINEDVLKIDLNKLIELNKNENIKKAKIVANLPYYITTPIIMKLLEEKLNIESITVMIQKEVAQRLAAKPGEKEVGSITYTIWYYTEPKIVLEVPRDSFIPEPEVTSSVINLKVLDKPRIEVEDEKVFFKVIKAAFMQKRKTLINALVNGKIFENKEEAEKCLIENEIDTKIRGEKLSLEQYKMIADYLKK